MHEVYPPTPTHMHIINEHYHIYNRGAHKEPIFLDKSDYERFIALLLVANSEKPIKNRWSHHNTWSKVPESKLVHIFAYCLMPNHFHIGLIEIKERGIERFTHKLITSYSMYYNIKYKHSGTIFQGNYKWKHVDSDEYLRYLIQYIHLNPFGIDEPELIKTAKPEFLNQAIECSKKYEYSSYKDYLGVSRKEGLILNLDVGG